MDEKQFLRCELNDRIISLLGIDMLGEKQRIEDEINFGNNPIFVLKADGGKLSSYIDWMYDEGGLSNKLINRFMLCKYIEFTNLVTLVVQKNGSYRPGNISELISILLKFNNVCIVIENNDRTLLADILQQLIYIEYPINKVDIKLRKEFKDAEKTQRFMDRAKVFFEQAVAVQEKLEELCIEAPTEEEKNELFEIRANTITSYKNIEEQIQKAGSVEMKIAIAASKKTGKSVLANSMIEMELAPTSLELATPNTCIYKKSQDDRFRLIYGNEEQKSENVFDSRKDIYRAVQQEFKKAQENDKSKYLIPDMEIQYVSKKNNFDSYTIFDTPGPDAAGTDHYKSANKAIEECDVAVFAIDYSKYLTSSEEEFLSRIKTVFEEKKKFHTLIFTINKIDLALQDKGAKSRIKSIDFIRNRIMELDEKYKDCVIFATSARDYFYTLELEDEAEKNTACKELLGNDLFDGVRNTMRGLDDSEQDTIDLLSRIDAEVGMLAMQLGHKEVYVDTLKNYSGMPQLLSYISYIAKSKAREEIVNSITYMIDTEISRLRGIIDNISNIESLITANTSTIERIRDILNDYYNGAKAVLDKENLLEGDFAALNKGNNIDIFSNAERYRKKHPGDTKINLKNMYSILNEDIDQYDWRDIKKEVLTELHSFWKKKMDTLVGEKKKYVGTDELTITSVDCNQALQNRLNNFQNDKVKHQTSNLNAFIRDLIALLNARGKKVNALSEKCRTSLEKEDCTLKLPVLPSFGIGFIKPNINIEDIKHDINNINLSEYFKARWFQAIANFFNPDLSVENWLEYKEVEFKPLSESQQKEVFKNIDAEVGVWLTDTVKLDNVLDDIVNKLKEVVGESEAKIEETFIRSNEVILGNIGAFKNMIDDTERYRENNEALYRKQDLIRRIEEYSQDFMDIWKQILGDNEV